jgi:hypothetical protein
MRRTSQRTSADAISPLFDAPPGRFSVFRGAVRGYPIEKRLDFEPNKLLILRDNFFDFEMVLAIFSP